MSDIAKIRSDVNPKTRPKARVTAREIGFGPLKRNPEKICPAIHEGGHMVMAVLTKTTVVHATLKPEPSIGSLGHILVYESSDCTLEDLESRIMVRYAGCAAQMACLSGRCFWPNDMDFKSALVWLVCRFDEAPGYRELNEGEDLQFMRQRINHRRAICAATMRKRRFKRATRFFSEALIARGSLRRTEIRSLARRSRLLQRPEKHALMRCIYALALEFEQG